MSGPGVVSPFVGRDDELRRLAEALSRAADGGGGAVFLTGQSGVGKTRLSQEALGLAEKRGFRVLEGRAYPMGVGLSYALILDAFGPLLRSLDPARLTSLTSGLPDLGRLFGGLSLPAPVLPLEGLGDPGLEKARLFEAVLRLLERLAQESPVVLVVDDVHRADSASLESLHYLARGLPGQRVLLLAIYSGEGFDSCRGLRAMTGWLLRAGQAEEIVVPRLGPDAVEEMARGILGGEAPPGLIALLAARAGGTPLYIEALIAALVDSGNLKRESAGNDGWVLDTKGKGYFT